MVVLACIKLRFPLTEVAYFLKKCNYTEMLEPKEVATGSLPPQKSPPQPTPRPLSVAQQSNSGFGRLIVEFLDHTQFRNTTLDRTPLNEYQPVAEACNWKT